MPTSTLWRRLAEAKDDFAAWVTDRARLTPTNFTAFEVVLTGSRTCSRTSGKRRATAPAAYGMSRGTFRDRIGGDAAADQRTSGTHGLPSRFRRRSVQVRYGRSVS